MPKAEASYVTAVARVPRTLFIHAHADGVAEFPPSCNLQLNEMIEQLPDNWNGTDKVIVWFLAGEPWVNEPFDFVLNAGKGTEAPNIHTQALANRLLTCANGVYLAEDLTASIVAFIALITSGDIIWVTAQDDNGIAGYCIGLELQET